MHLKRKAAKINTKLHEFKQILVTTKAPDDKKTGNNIKSEKIE